MTLPEAVQAIGLASRGGDASFAQDVIAARVMTIIMCTFYLHVLSELYSTQNLFLCRGIFITHCTRGED